MVPQINISTQLCIIHKHLPLSLFFFFFPSLMRFPFTATQWQELEHQALVFKYMVFGIPIPPDLLFPIKTTLDSSLSSNFLIHQHQHIAGWNGFQIGFGRKIDPEPGRCRRTDGKKWRCSKEAYPDSKYCERHMHRGRNRSRKPVEILSPAPPQQQPSSLKSAAAPSESHFLHPHFPSSRESPNFFLEPNPYSKPQTRDCRTKGEINEVAFFPADSDSYSSLVKPKSYSFDLGEKIEAFDDSNCRQHDRDRYHFYSGDAADEQPKKVMHHFLDEWAPHESKSEEKMRTELSISVPNSSS